MLDTGDTMMKRMNSDPGLEELTTQEILNEYIHDFTFDHGNEEKYNIASPFHL